MKFYGYKNEGLEIDQIISSELAEVTLVASPEELKMIAEFLESAADEMIRMGESYDHEHLSDKNKVFESSPHFVVARE
ncbi:MAG: hypothetical protein PVF82_17750 [Gammaproteobacteria bacterium]|jgi:hypothetical protein